MANSPHPHRRGPGRPFAKGGDPRRDTRGRPRSATSFAEAVRERVDPDELIDLALAIARGEPLVVDLNYLRDKAKAIAAGTPLPEISGVEVKWPSPSDRMSALAFLRDSGFQKPAQVHEIGPARETLRDYAKMSDEELAKLEELLESAPAALPGGPDEVEVLPAGEPIPEPVKAG